MKKKKSDMHIHVDMMVLTMGDFDVIGDKVHDTMTELWIYFEKQYQQALGNVQKDLHVLEIQTGRPQASVG